MKQRKKHMIFGVVLCLLLFMAAPLAAEEPLRCTVSCDSSSGAPIGGVEFRIYRVASVEKDLSYTLIGDFKDLAVSLKDLSAAETKAVAETLAAYVARDGITPTDRAVTDANGNAEFPETSAKLESGLYLILGDAAEIDGKTYVFEPILLPLPYREAAADAPLYDVMVSPKLGERVDADSLSAVKIWKDDGSDRPEKIEVQLLKDGALYDTQALNAKNSWRYTWTNLPAGSDWQIVEKEVPVGYTVLIRREQTTISVTNTAESGKKDPSESETSSGKLPQTGMVWWPIPLLAFAGLVLLLLGLIRHRRHGE